MACLVPLRSLAQVELRPHPPASDDQRLAKRVQLGLDVVGVQHGLGYFLAQELRMATAQAMDQRFQGRQSHVQRPRRLFVAQVNPGAFMAKEGPQDAKGLGFAPRGLLSFQVACGTAQQLQGLARIKDRLRS